MLKMKLQKALGDIFLTACGEDPKRIPMVMLGDRAQTKIQATDGVLPLLSGIQDAIGSYHQKYGERPELLYLTEGEAVRLSIEDGFRYSPRVENGTKILGLEVVII